MTIAFEFPAIPFHWKKFSALAARLRGEAGGMDATDRADAFGVKAQTGGLRRIRVERASFSLSGRTISPWSNFVFPKSKRSKFWL